MSRTTQVVRGASGGGSALSAAEPPNHLPLVVREPLPTTPNHSLKMIMKGREMSRKQRQPNRAGRCRICGEPSNTLVCTLCSSKRRTRPHRDKYAREAVVAD